MKLLYSRFLSLQIILGALIGELWDCMVATGTDGLVYSLELFTSWLYYGS